MRLEEKNARSTMEKADGAGELMSSAEKSRESVTLDERMSRGAGPHGRACCGGVPRKGEGERAFVRPFGITHVDPTALALVGKFSFMKKIKSRKSIILKREKLRKIHRGRELRGDCGGEVTSARGGK